MFVRHVMTSEVHVLDRATSCGQAYAEFRARRIRRAPVVEHGRMVGIVTLHDLLHILPGTVGQEESDAGSRAWNLSVDTVMRRPVLTTHPNDHLEAAALVMLEHKVGGLPVVRDREIVGMLTESDIFRALWGVLSSGAGWRVIVEEHPGQAEFDYAAMLAHHGARLESLLRFRVPAGGSVVFLRSAGGEPAPVISSLWAAGVTVLQVDRK